MTTPLNRRDMLTAGAALVSIRVTSPAKAARLSPVSTLIARHKAAHAAFRDACGYEDRIKKSDPAFVVAKAEWTRTNDAEELALDELCAFRPATMDEVRERGDYLAAFTARCSLTEYQVEVLLNSFMS